MQLLLEKPLDSDTVQEFALAMVQSKVLRQLERMDNKVLLDEDCAEDVTFIQEKLEATVHELRLASSTLAFHV